VGSANGTAEGANGAAGSASNGTTGSMGNMCGGVGAGASGGVGADAGVGASAGAGAGVGTGTGAGAGVGTSAGAGVGTSAGANAHEHGTANRHVNPDEPFGVDIHNNPNAVVYGDFYVDASSVNRYVGILNSFRQTIPETTRILCLLTPTKIEFMDEKYKANSARQDTTIQYIYEKLDPGIVKVDAYSWIAARAASEYLYFRTDHHWTAVGAYYAYRAFADTAGITPVKINNYIEHSISDYIGSYGTGTQDKVILENPDTLYYYQLDNGTAFSQNLFFIPENRNNLSYMVFMGGDHALIDFSSSNKNGNILIIIKDSYANAFIPWVAPNYERIIVIDPRQYEGSIDTYLKESAKVDVLFLNSAFTPSLPAFVEKIAEIR
jgi:hypothetical protein